MLHFLLALGRSVNRVVLLAASLQVMFVMPPALFVSGLNIASASPFDPTLVTFDNLHAGDILTTQIPGIAFTNTTILTAGVNLNEFDFPPVSPPNVAASIAGDLVAIEFDDPLFSFAAVFTHRAPILLRALDGAGAVIATANSSYANNLGAGDGDPASIPNEEIKLTAPAGQFFKDVNITTTDAQAPFVFDNMRANNDAPEPVTLVLFASGLILLGVVRGKAAGVRRPNTRPLLCSMSIAVRRLLCESGKSMRRHAVLIVASLLCVARADGASIGPIQVTPLGIAGGKPATITVLAKIDDPALIPQSVNLVLLSASGSPTILGQLRDNGSDGDLVAGDHIYTIVTSVVAASGTSLHVAVSAAFRDQLQRTMSTAVTIGAVPDAGLPPDPGEAGRILLTGIDSDNDGVRDDVQRYIALVYPASAKTRAAATQIAKAVQGMIADSGNQQAASSDVASLGRALECSVSISGAATTPHLFNDLKKQLLNSIPRLRAYYAADAQFSGTVYKLSNGPAKKALCAFNPDALPN